MVDKKGRLIREEVSGNTSLRRKGWSWVTKDGQKGEEKCKQKEHLHQRAEMCEAAKHVLQPRLVVGMRAG